MREIQEFPGYHVCEDGRVWSAPRGGRCGQFLKPAMDDQGHVRYSFRRNGKLCRRFAHRLVLEAFVGPSEGKIGRHLDGNPQNNHVSNLCWGTHLENQRDRKKHGTDNVGERNGNAVLTWEIVRNIRYLARNSFVLKKDLADRYGISPSHVSNIIANKCWKENLHY